MVRQTSCWNWGVLHLGRIVRGNSMSAIEKIADSKVQIIRACIREMSPAIGPYDRNRCPHASMR